MGSPSITVVTPSLNQGSFILESIRSVLNQDYPFLQYIVVDGGSSDQTISILKSFSDRLTWISEPDSGQAAAINKGWRMAKGDILGWLNSDDLYLPGTLQRVANYLNAHPDVDILYGNCDYIDDFGQWIKSYPTQPYNYDCLVISTTNYIPQPATFMHRRVLETIGYLDERLQYVMDLDYWLKAGIACRITHLPFRLACLRIHPSAKSIASLSRFGDELVTIYQHYFQRTDIPKHLQTLSRQIMHTVYMRASDCAFWGNELGTSRHYAWKAWRIAPMHIHWLFGILLLGRLGYRMVTNRKANPYLILP